MDIAELLAFSVKNKASDLHLSAGLPPMIRVDGDVRRINIPALDHKQVHALVSAVTDRFGYLEIGVHLHSRPNQARDKILAAYDAGCRRFDSALGGLGGCPFAQDMLVGNIPTEILLAALRERGAELPPFKSLDALLRASTELGARYATSYAAD